MLKHLKAKRRSMAYRLLDMVTLCTVTLRLDQILKCFIRKGERCLVLELGNFRSLGLGFGLEPQTSGLRSCPVRLGLGLDSRHGGLGLDSDSRKRGLVATQSLSTWIGYEFGLKSHHIRDHCRLPNCTIIKAKFHLNLLELICWWCITRIIWTKFHL